jgi:hypothetical protein
MAGYISTPIDIITPPQPRVKDIISIPIDLVQRHHNTCNGNALRLAGPRHLQPPSRTFGRGTTHWLGLELAKPAPLESAGPRDPALAFGLRLNSVHSVYIRGHWGIENGLHWRAGGQSPLSNCESPIPCFAVLFL